MKRYRLLLNQKPTKYPGKEKDFQGTVAIETNKEVLGWLSKWLDCNQSQVLGKLYPQSFSKYPLPPSNEIDFRDAESPIEITPCKTWSMLIIPW